jgi:hypothetical protein
MLFQFKQLQKKMLLHFENYALILVRSVHVSIKKKKVDYIVRY